MALKGRCALWRKEDLMRKQMLTAVSLFVTVSGCSGVEGAGNGQMGGEPVARAEQKLGPVFDFGVFRDGFLESLSNPLFGFNGSVPNSTASVDAATANADPTKLIGVAHGLNVRVVSARAELGANTDQMAFWPDDVQPTHLIVINEQGTTNPGVQRIRLSDGSVETILTGTTSGDPIRGRPGARSWPARKEALRAR
jgi:hypothetical protein